MRVKPEFNQLHQMHFDRERGWRHAPDFFSPRPPKPARYFIDKHIFVYSDQLFYEVDAVTHIVTKARRRQEAQDAGMETSEADDYRPMFYRWFDMYLRKAESTMSAYIIKKDRVNQDNALREWKEKDIWLRMPDYWDSTRFESLTNAIHRFISLGAIYEYMSLTLTSKDPVTIDKKQQLDDAELDIIQNVNAVIPGSVHKILKPF